jgi:hypothetical protein
VESNAGEYSARVGKIKLTIGKKQLAKTISKSYRIRLRQFIFFNLSKYTKTGGLGAFTIKLDSQH